MVVTKLWERTTFKCKKHNETLIPNTGRLFPLICPECYSKKCDLEFPFQHYQGFLESMGAMIAENKLHGIEMDLTGIKLKDSDFRYVIDDNGDETYSVLIE